MKILKNKSQAVDESKLEPMSLDKAMERLGYLAGTDKPTLIMRWMGLGSSTYTNWQRSQRVPYDKIVEVLLKKGISLDVFFAPGVTLEAPLPLMLEETEGAEYIEQDKSLIVRATLESQALLARVGFEDNETIIQFLTDLWFFQEGKLFEQPEFISALKNHLELLDQAGLKGLFRKR